MVRNLIKNNIPVVVFDVVPDALKSITDAGENIREISVIVLKEYRSLIC